MSRAKGTTTRLIHAEENSGREVELREALARIAEVASRAVGDGDYSAHAHDEEEDDLHHAAADSLSCIPKSLPERLRIRAAEVSAEINPVNSPAFWRRSAFAAGLTPTPEFIAAVTTKYWGPQPRMFSVSFMETTPSDLRRRIVSHMNAWTKTGGISFAETTGVGQVRISREPGGFWSYLGTDILLIPKSRQTMNLEGFTMTTAESEYKRVVRHEAGHTLGFPHEHMRKALVARIDPKKAYAFAAANYGWDKKMVDEQILKTLDEKTLMATPPDQTSIMCYQLPGSITFDGKPIIGGEDINASDYAFVGKIYPKVSQAVPLVHDLVYSDDWPASEDVVEVDV
jgi:hypothetical protein